MWNKFKAFLENAASILLTILIGTFLILCGIIPTVLIYQAVINEDLPAWVLFLLK